MVDEIADEQKSLSELAAEIYQLIDERDATYFEGITPELHEMPPFVPKTLWNKLGDQIKVAENPPSPFIPGQYWISIRCDGNNFSNLTKRFRDVGIFEDDGWSPSFAKIMVSCCHALMDFFKAKCGFTQSDEITVLIPPASVIHGVQNSHMHNGRVQKLCSLASAVVTAEFNRALVTMCQDRNNNDDHVENFDLSEYPPAIFDCRVGRYQTMEEAVSLILWRSYDCYVNGVSDAVYKRKGKIEGAGDMVKKGTKDKLIWLARHNLLPLHPHQRAGSYFVKYRKKLDTVNQKTGKPVVCLRSARHQMEGNLLNLWKEGQFDSLLPQDETIELSV